MYGFLKLCSESSIEFQSHGLMEMFSNQTSRLSAKKYCFILSLCLEYNTAQRLRGEPGTEVSLLLRSNPNNQLRRIRLTRSHIILENVVSRMVLAPKTVFFNENGLSNQSAYKNPWNWLFGFNGFFEKIGYVRLTDFSRDAPNQLQSAISALEKRMRKRIISIFEL